MSTLYDLTDKLTSLQRLAEDDTVDPALIADTMDSIEGDFEDKAVGYVKVYKSIEADVDEINAEIKRLQERKASFKNNANTIKQRLVQAMVETGNERIKTPLFTIYTRRTVSVQAPEDPNKLPPEFIKTTLSVNKADLKKALQSGREVPNARLVENVSLGVK
ncbi:siphovirus Gp157 family protein [Lacticaseibacillus suilingensis]|uniref:Siphovirus Gp157 family protein n=1 Tax=Lacticaseibacillus suilingensis TaxID=2799577 RepID=A0ABW4BFM3_9LACO|nr:siphovirus Gp157 family protein [Lacticaseibacillus suilingensis]